MKILFISTSVLPVPPVTYGGIEQLIFDFADWVKKTHPSDEVVLAGVVGSKTPKDVRFIPTVNVPLNQDRDDLALLKYIGEWSEYDVIHDFSHKKLLGQLVKDSPTINMVWHPCIVKYPMPSYNAVCLSYWQANRFNLLYNQNAVVLDLMVNEEVYQFYPEKGERFLYVGKLSEEKGAELAVDYCIKMDAPLDIVGGILPTDSREYGERIKRRCDGKKIVFHGNVSNDEKIRLMQRAKALIYPVIQAEAHCQTIAECLMCGTPVIVHNYGAMGEIMEEGVTGFTPTYLSRRSFLKAMQRVGEIDPKDCREFALERFSRPKVGEKYYYLYSKVREGYRW